MSLGAWLADNAGAVCRWQACWITSGSQTMQRGAATCTAPSPSRQTRTYNKPCRSPSLRHLPVQASAAILNLSSVSHHHQACKVHLMLQLRPVVLVIWVASQTGWHSWGTLSEGSQVLGGPQRLFRLLPLQHLQQSCRPSAQLQTDHHPAFPVTVLSQRLNDAASKVIEYSH